MSYFLKKFSAIFTTLFIKPCYEAVRLAAGSAAKNVTLFESV